MLGILDELAAEDADVVAEAVEVALTLLIVTDEDGKRTTAKRRGRGGVLTGRKGVQMRSQERRMQF
jgi:hypothetical protein